MKKIALLFALFVIGFIILADNDRLGSLYSIYAFPNGDKVGHFLLFGLLTLFIDLAFFQSLPGPGPEEGRGFNRLDPRPADRRGGILAKVLSPANLFMAGFIGQLFGDIGIFPVIAENQENPKVWINLWGLCVARSGDFSRFCRATK